MFAIICLRKKNILKFPEFRIRNPDPDYIISGFLFFKTSFYDMDLSQSNSFFEIYPSFDFIRVSPKLHCGKDILTRYYVYCDWSIEIFKLKISQSTNQNRHNTQYVYTFQYVTGKRIRLNILTYEMQYTRISTKIVYHVSKNSIMSASGIQLKQSKKGYSSP